MIWNEAPIADVLAKDEFYTHELFIWFWHTYGYDQVSKMPEWVSQQDRFAECFDGKAKGKCGFKSSSSIRKALEKNSTAELSESTLKKLFEGGPPPEAITFAMKSLGTCFGDDPSLPTLDELGLFAGEFDIQVCSKPATELELRPEKLGDDLAAYRSWGVALRRYMSRPGVFDRRKECRVAPIAARPLMQEYLGRVEKREREIAAYENRSVAERVAGLNAMQIAYSLVYRTNSGEHEPTRPMPQGSFDWQANYAQKVRDGYPEPGIPQAVMDWALEQPLTRFEPVEDPFEARYRLHEAELTDEIWARHVASRLNKLAPQTPRIRVNEGCDILMNIVRNDIQFGKRTPQTRGEAEYYRLVSQSRPSWAQIMCNETPAAIFENAKTRYEVTQREKAEKANRLAEPQAPNEWDEILKGLNDYANRPSSKSGPYQPPTTRCYTTGYTESGLANRVCFEN
ncbi:hypothetical protein GCM10011342_19090 [Aquisalinus flavus]|uniref:Uncharacterized protein n=2 Tax=Aquisalinus flavus TaxID=1526572 RepID=A0A8J2V1Q3_9PROT|nr:hypothetical protein GCM10011342_19090 [Aquisalinus flavus]